ncbi:hypothetical protein Dimus_002532 [Dionaea muscipula]
MADSKLVESGPGSSEPNLSVCDKKPRVVEKKIPLRDLQNKNNIADQSSSGTPLFCKEKVPSTEGVKVSGAKRPPSESPVNPWHNSSPSSNGANGHLVYVRRKLETEVGKNNNTNEIVGHKADYHQPRQIGSREDAMKSQVVEGRKHGFPALAPVCTAPVMTFSYGKPSVPPNLGASNNASSVSLSNQRRIINQNWQERYLQLQMHLKKLDQLSQEDYLQTLRSLSSAELSKHAVELEKRAIHLSLEEGKELQRVRSLNVLGKSIRDSKLLPVQHLAQN